MWYVATLRVNIIIVRIFTLFFPENEVTAVVSAILSLIVIVLIVVIVVIAIVCHFRKRGGTQISEQSSSELQGRGSFSQEMLNTPIASGTSPSSESTELQIVVSSPERNSSERTQNTIRACNSIGEEEEEEEEEDTSSGEGSESEPGNNATKWRSRSFHEKGNYQQLPDSSSRSKSLPGHNRLRAAVEAAASLAVGPIPLSPRQNTPRKRHSVSFRFPSTSSDPDELKNLMGNTEPK